MTSDIFGIGIWGQYESPSKFRCGASENFSKIQVSTIKTSAFFVKKHISIWVPQCVREANCCCCDVTKHAGPDIDAQQVRIPKTSLLGELIHECQKWQH